MTLRHAAYASLRNAVNIFLASLRLLLQLRQKGIFFFIARVDFMPFSFKASQVSQEATYGDSYPQRWS